MLLASKFDAHGNGQIEGTDLEKISQDHSGKVRSCETHEGNVDVLLHNLFNVAYGVWVLNLNSDDEVFVRSRLVRAAQCTSSVREHRTEAADAVWRVLAGGDDFAHDLYAVSHGYHDAVCARVEGSLGRVQTCMKLVASHNSP